MHKNTDIGRSLEAFTSVRKIALENLRTYLLNKYLVAIRIVVSVKTRQTIKVRLIYSRIQSIRPYHVENTSSRSDH